MLYSCLVDADFLDTECFMQNGKTEREQGEAMNVLLKKLEDHIVDWLNVKDIDTINEDEPKFYSIAWKQGRAQNVVCSG